MHSPPDRYDGETFEGKLHSWIPYLRAPRKCELNCMPQGERFYYRHAKKVRRCIADNVLQVSKSQKCLKTYEI